MAAERWDGFHPHGGSAYSLQIFKIFAEGAGETALGPLSGTRWGQWVQSKLPSCSGLHDLARRGWNSVLWLHAHHRWRPEGERKAQNLRNPNQFPSRAAPVGHAQPMASLAGFTSTGANERANVRSVFWPRLEEPALRSN